MKGIYSVFCVCAWIACATEGLATTIMGGEYVCAVCVAVTSAMAFPYVKEKVMEGLK